ncbi:hypothetical protein [Gemmatimonas groenlandica]|uniref:BIG2 domain-containing protein n=1 Tax=Gemmatimonas groenlandica TaxID=2732249 RepID=A0A6M4IQF8_9BACT|nr:hypothetical protein [Gemmatimonas groenlandica]QJR36980.1 hypothetical protein HKW67_16365 [Gemmatimonas groenlandica]
MRNVFLVCVVVAAVVAGGCNNVTDLVCPADPARVKVSPTSRTMNVGEQFTPTVTAAVCGGTQPTPFVGRFTATNVAVARVDSVRGVITGVASGETYVFARYTTDGFPLGGTRDSIRVTVR